MIEKLIAEAQELGVDIHDHVAEKHFGVLNPETHRLAKNLTFCHLYGGKGKKVNAQPITMPAVHKDFTLKGAQTGRTQRVGVQTYKVRVFHDTFDPPIDYTVAAIEPLDARCMAFILDGGCEPTLTDWDDGHIELALTWTEIIE
jgi:hypothetical protein